MLTLGLFGMLYGLNPEALVPFAFGITVDTIAAEHFFRATAGAYFALIICYGVLLLLSRFRSALYFTLILAVVMAAARIFSIAMDGLPGLVFIGVTGLEIIIAGLTAYSLLNENVQDL